MQYECPVCGRLTPPGRVFPVTPEGVIFPQPAVKTRCLQCSSPAPPPAPGPLGGPQVRPSRTRTVRGLAVAAALVALVLGLGCLIDLLHGRNPFVFSREKTLYERWEEEHRDELMWRKIELENEQRWQGPERQRREILGLPERAPGGRQPE